MVSQRTSCQGICRRQRSQSRLVVDRHLVPASGTSASISIVRQCRMTASSYCGNELKRAFLCKSLHIARAGLVPDSRPSWSSVWRICRAEVTIFVLSSSSTESWGCIRPRYSRRAYPRTCRLLEFLCARQRAHCKRRIRRQSYLSAWRIWNRRREDAVGRRCRGLAWRDPISGSTYCFLIFHYRLYV